MRAFDETPPNPICKKVEDIIKSIRYPVRPERQPFLTAPNDHFLYTRVLVDYPDDLYNLTHEGSIVSGWIQEISSFWAANMHSLFLFSWDLSNIKYTPTPSPVICVGFINGYIIAVYNKGISVFSFPDFQSLKTKYSIPLNVNITTIKYGLAGCNDGSLRKITLNPSRASVSVSGFLSLKEDDAVIQIIRTDNCYVTLTLSGHVSIYGSQDINRLATYTELKNILNIWYQSGDDFLAIDNNSIVYLFQYNNYKLKVTTISQLIERMQFQSAFYDHGILTAVDSNRPSFDTIFTGRFGTFPVYTINRNLGGIHSIGSTTADIKIFTSSGIYSVSEKLKHNENEEIWRFCNAIEGIWDKPLLEVDTGENDNYLIEQLNSFYDSDFEFLSNLSSYILTIFEDFQVLGDSKYSDYFQNSHLSDFFSADRNKYFPLLRHISFGIRSKQGEAQNEDSLPDEVELLIRKANNGNREAAASALSVIKSFKTLPTNYSTYCDFMFSHGFYRDLLECVVSWADSVYRDEDALAFENANFPMQDESAIYSYHLRSLIYEKMNPLLNVAVGKSDEDDKEKRFHQEKKAVEALRYSLNMSNVVFQRFVLKFLDENCPPERLKDFMYPEMIDELKMMRSRHLVTVLLHKNMKKDAFDLFVDEATFFDPENEDEEASRMTIDERIGSLQKALELFPTDEKVSKLLETANLLKSFLQSHPEVRQDLFALDFIDINDVLVSHREYSLALDVMNFFGEKRTDVLSSFLSEADLQEVKEYVKKNSVFSLTEIAHEIYHLKKLEAFDFMFDCGIDNLYILQVLCELWRRGKLRNDIEFIKRMLERAGKVNLEIREQLADVLCEITLDLDSVDRIDDANAIRENLQHCFLEQSFSDINDL